MMDKYSVEVFTPEQFDLLHDCWKQLESGEDMSIFQTYDWFKNINALYFKEHTKNIFRRWEYILIRLDNEPVMIAPIQIILVGWQYKCVGLRKGFYFIGRQGYSDYLNLIYHHFQEEAFLVLSDYLKKKYHTSYFCFEQLLETTELAKYIIANYKHAKSECYCADLVLPNTFDEYNGLLSKSTRQNIRTAINRQKRDNRELVHSLTYTIDDELANTLMDIRAMRLDEKRKKSGSKASWKGKLYGKMRRLLINLFTAEQEVIRENCNPWCFLVKEGERIASFFWGIYEKEKKIYYVILAGVDPEYAWYSPSISHLYLFIKEQYENDDRIFNILDFTRGGERYKEDMGGCKKIAWTISFRCK